MVDTNTQTTTPITPPAPPDLNSPVITPESMTPATPAPFAQPNPSPLPTLPQPLTPDQIKANDLSTSIAADNSSMVGKTQFQQDQEAKFGVNDAQKTLTDLNTQLTQLHNDFTANQIKLGGNNTIENGAVYNAQNDQLTRTHTIAALGLSSLIAAAQGQLSNAQSLADKAVAAKYGPIQEDITAKTANLNLILNSPEYTQEEKAQAQTALDQQKSAQETLDKQKQDAQGINQIAIDAASKGADAQTLQQISTAKTPLEATQIAAKFTQQKANLTAIQAAQIKTPFASVGGEIQDSKTGYAFTDPKDFQAKTGMTVQQAQAKGLVTPLQTSNLTSKDTQTVNVGGRTLLINSITGQTIKDLGPTSGTSTPKISAGDAISAIETGWKSEGMIQGNGKISSTDYQAAKQQWLSWNLSADAFDAAFNGLIDKTGDTWKADYGFGAN